ncbi:hypothetical protein ACVWW4_006625 [Bradyrhizobium sp. LB7.1]
MGSHSTLFVIERHFLAEGVLLAAAALLGALDARAGDGGSAEGKNPRAGNAPRVISMVIRRLFDLGSYERTLTFWLCSRFHWFLRGNGL